MAHSLVVADSPRPVVALSLVVSHNLVIAHSPFVAHSLASVLPRIFPRPRGGCYLIQNVQ